MEMPESEEFHNGPLVPDSKSQSELGPEVGDTVSEPDIVQDAPAHPPSPSTTASRQPSPTESSTTELNKEDGLQRHSPYPRLSYDPPTSPEIPLLPSLSNPEDEEPAIAQSFDRSGNIGLPSSGHSLAYDAIGDDGICKMHKFSLYETATRYYLVGGDMMDNRFRIIKIDRTAESGSLSIDDDDIIYNKKEMNQILNAIDDGNRSSGGMRLKCSTWGLLGFIRFTGPYYMFLITKRSQVAMIGGHYVYQVDGTELVPLTTASQTRQKAERNPEEARFLTILNNLDLTRSFYFSYSYDITRTLQHNMMKARRNLNEQGPLPTVHDFNEMFVWNHYLLEPAVMVLKNTYDWCLPIIHGFIDQATLSIYGRAVYITIIARRSRFFAGARFLKRGANDLGYVANDVETEQIVSEMLTTSFHGPGPKLYANPNYTSYVQHRGSIPLYWTQDNTGVTPKPPIELNLVDPFYTAAALHFDNLFERYGAPIYVLNLVKSRERTPRESKLLKEYTNAITYLNQFLPTEKKIIYKSWDMSRASKSRDQDVIGTLEAIAEDVLQSTGFFQNGDENGFNSRTQNGVARTNCIDCLDRTNAAQFVIGKRALGRQLHAMGIINDTSIDYDSDAVNLFTHMFHDHGDTIAIQYGGSHLVNTMETYRKINQWTSHSRDMVESFKRYYNNSFLDGQRQEAYNLFLGNYIFAQGQPMLWDLATDYYLHHADPRAWSEKGRRNYIKWYTPRFLEPREMPPLIQPPTPKLLEFYDDYWLEYYRPLAVSSFLKIFSFRMNSTLRYIPFKSTQDGRYDLSPFKARVGQEHDSSEKRRAHKEVTIRYPQEEETPSAFSTSSQKGYDLLPYQSPSSTTAHASIMKRPRPVEAPALTKEGPPADKALAAQWALQQLMKKSLNPAVTESEMKEYRRYVSHPLNLPLVVSTDEPPDADLNFVDYVNRHTVDALNMQSTEEEVEEYQQFLTVSDAPLAVSEWDTPKPRYKAYHKWLRGKSLFKQQILDT